MPVPAPLPAIAAPPPSPAQPLPPLASPAPLPGKGQCHWHSLPHLEGGGSCTVLANDSAASVLGTKVRLWASGRVQPGPAAPWLPPRLHARTPPGSERGSGSHGRVASVLPRPVNVPPWGQRTLALLLSPSVCPAWDSRLTFVRVPLSEGFRTSGGAVTLPRDGHFSGGGRMGTWSSAARRPLPGSAGRWWPGRPQLEVLRRGASLRSQACARALTCLHTCAEVFTLGVCPCAAALTPLSLPHTHCPFWAISAVRFLRFHSCGFPCSLRSASADQRTPCPCDRVGTARPHSSRLTFKVTFPEHRLTPLSLDCRHTAPASPPALLAVAARSSIRD